MDAGWLEKIDTPEFDFALGLVDPINYLDELADIPKLVLVSSDDEFMMMDQTNLWYDQMTGEKHLLIVPNTDHLLFTNLPSEFSTYGTFARSIASGKPLNSRPSF